MFLEFTMITLREVFKYVLKEDALVKYVYRGIL